MRRLLYIILCLFAVEAQAQEKTDTTKKLNVLDTLKKDLLTAPDTVQHLHSKGWTLIPPAILISYGASSFFLHPLRRLDHYIYDEANEHNFLLKRRVENYFQYAPMVLVYGFNLVGIHGKNTFVDRTLTLVTAQGLLQLTVFTLKKTTHRLRPNGGDYLSFPSGHTANAFAGAEFMSQELSGKSEWYGVLGYAFAVTTGTLRIYHQNHWFSDVVAGAGFGILATKGAYLLYPYIRNSLFNGAKKKEELNKDVPSYLRKQKAQKSTILMPSYQDGTVGLQFAMEL